MSSTYDKAFYENRRRQTLHTAQAVLGVVSEVLVPASVADIGCGTGTFLTAALAGGAVRAIGLEGSWVSGEQVDNQAIDFRNRDLEQRFTLGERVDLAISLEVAEHLTPERADTFVADLCACSPAILFSAAIPGQGGVNHVNEQWQSYWARKFEANGYRAYDIVRPVIWSDEGIPAWYRQNIILYLDRTLASRASAAPSAPKSLDLVHPEFWNRANRELKYANALPESEYLKQQAAEAGAPRP